MSPSTTQTDQLFPALSAGLGQFRERVEGTEGDYRERLLRLEGQQGIVPAVTLAVLEAIAELLVWLYEAIIRLAVFILQADSAIALIEVFGTGLRGIGEALDREWPQGLMAAGKVADALSDIGGTLAQLDEVGLPGLIPRPGTLEQIEGTAFHLVRSRVDPELESGSLDQLLEDLQVDGSGA